MEGAALLAVLAPSTSRAPAVHALVAFQSAYNYLDMLAEQPCADASANAGQLHQALHSALDPSAPHSDYYALHPSRDDGGYLVEMIQWCRAAVGALPSFAAVATAARSATERIVDFQRLNLGVHQGDHHGLERWGRRITPPHSGLSWWESAAAGGSSLDVHVLIGLGANPYLDSCDQAIRTIEEAYFPWITALHSLLDSTIDIAEDRHEGQRNLLDYYDSPAQAAIRLGYIARQARAHISGLQQGSLHQLILAAMTAYYLSAPQARGQRAAAVALSVREASGARATTLLRVLKAARFISPLVRSLGSRC